MSLLAITDEGVAYKDAVFAGEELQNITRVIFRNIDGLLPETAIDLTQSLPSTDIVHSEPIERVSALDDNAVVMSTVLGYDIGNFEYNWYGVVAQKEDLSEVLIAVVQTPVQTKTKTDGATTGNYSVKSIVWKTANIALSLSVSLSALPWQLPENTFVTQAAYELAMAEKSNKTHDHDSAYLGKTAKAYSALVSDDAELLAGRNPDHYRGLTFGSPNDDPNEATHQVMLTNHANSPVAGYWYVTTTFYSEISATSPRGQVAVSYGSPQMYTRSDYSGVWSAWVRCDNNDPAIKIIRGTNSSGDYVKFPDGTLICNMAAASSGTSTPIAHALPHAFLSGTSIRTFASGINSRLVSASVNTAGTVFYAWGRLITGAYTITDVTVMAIGRWK
jgi:hypothetical protein